MHDGLDIRAHLVDGCVHQDLAGAFPLPFYLVPLQITNDEIFRGHHALAYACGCSQDPVRTETNTDVPVVGRNPSFLIGQTADFDDLPAQIAIFAAHTFEPGGPYLLATPEASILSEAR